VTRFEVITHVLAPPESVFAESLSVEAHTASMSASGERAVAGVTSGRLTLGDQVTSACAPPVSFVDEQVAGPFRRWWHEHRFEDDGDGGTLMRDVIDFAAPAGPLGRMAETLVLRRHMTRLILRRNRHLKAVTERGLS
jgi:ligand-binding SRPBCC domain-containing protein